MIISKTNEMTNHNKTYATLKKQYVTAVTFRSKIIDNTNTASCKL